jgi:thiol-disulfide isomerase/thioredoxin
MDRRQAALAAMLGLPALRSHATQVRTKLAVDSLAPQPLGRRRDGSELVLADLSSQVVVVSFWASWCPKCQAELPELERLQMAGKDALKVVAINTEQSSEFRRVAKVLSSLTLTLTHDTDKAVGSIWLHDGAVPYNLVVDRASRVRYASYGWGNASLGPLLAAVNEALSAARTASASGTGSPCRFFEPSAARPAIATSIAGKDVHAPWFA